MHIIDLGLIDYRSALAEQHRVHARVVSADLPPSLIVCRHHPVITVGRSAKPGSLLLSREEYADRGIEVINVERGGDVTYHGPGQLTAYPIVPLAAYGNDLNAYLRSLEHAAICALEQIGLPAVRNPGSTGVWAAGRKIASIGIAVKRSVSYHGISIVVKRGELGNFSLIRPCGSSAAMTSAESELGRTVLFDDITHSLIRSLSHDECYAAVAR